MAAHPTAAFREFGSRSWWTCPYRMVPYSAAEVDLFFVLTGAGTVYMVPIEAVAGW